MDNKKPEVSDGSSVSSKENKSLYKKIKTEGENSEFVKRLLSKKDPDLGVFAGFLSRAVNEVSEEEFNMFLESGELPPMKLTTPEMQVLQGGGGQTRIRAMDMLVPTDGGTTISIAPGFEPKGPMLGLLPDKTTNFEFQRYGPSGSGVFVDTKSGKIAPAVWGNRS